MTIHRILSSPKFSEFVSLDILEHLWYNVMIDSWMTIQIKILKNIERIHFKFTEFWLYKNSVDEGMKVVVPSYYTTAVLNMHTTYFVQFCTYLYVDMTF